MNNFTIRKLNKLDYANYLTLINQFRPTVFTLEEYEDTLDKIDGNSTIWVIDYDAELIGTTTIVYEHKFIRNIVKLAHIEDVCIDERFRGKGLGNVLINHAVNEANKENCYKITLYCDEKLEHFYEKSGFDKKGIQMAKYFV
jgi:glucosamine-phosphate N-acetyltransferase